MVGNCILVELIFARPGIGLYISRAIDKADFNAIAGVTLVVGVLYVVTNIVVDALQSVADPESRSEGGTAAAAADHAVAPDQLVDVAPDAMGRAVPRHYLVTIWGPRRSPTSSSASPCSRRCSSAVTSLPRARRHGTPQLVLRSELLLLPISVLMVALVGSGAGARPGWSIRLSGVRVRRHGQHDRPARVLFRMAGRALDPGCQHRTRGMASAMMLGPLIGGISIAAFGLGAAFAIPAALLFCSVPLLWFRRDGARHRVGSDHGTAAGGATGAIGVAAPLPGARGVLLVTVICNLCYFAFIPLVPGDRQNLNAGRSCRG